MLKIFGRLVLSLTIVIATAWSCLALWYQLPLGLIFRSVAALLCAGFGLATIFLSWRGHMGRALLAYGAGFVTLLSWWAGITPMENRIWADEVSRHVRAEVKSSQVTLHNVRNFDWRSETDYTPRWETRTVDLEHLRSVDVAASYWMGPAIAHTLVSFGFDDGRYLTFSIKIRKERYESFSAIGGFFKQYETSLVAAEENDILRVRTNARGEDVYLYRINMDSTAKRAMFLAYLDEAGKLEKAPQFYNTLTANCTTIVFSLARHIVPGLPLDWRLLASGYLPDYLHDAGALTPGVDMATLHGAGRITERARTFSGDDALRFSRVIRTGMPGVTQ